MEPEHITAHDTVKNSFEEDDRGRARVETNGDRHDHVTHQASLNSSPTITHSDRQLFKSRDAIHPGNNNTNNSTSMSSMMNQVVMKTTPLLKERRGSLSRSQSLHVTTSTGQASSPSTILKITKLVSSPSFSAERAYPEILYSPTLKASKQKPAVLKTNSDLAIKMKNGTTTDVSEMTNGGSSGVSTRGKELKKKQPEELLVVRDNEEVIQVRAVLVKHTVRQHPVIIRQQCVSEEKELEKPEFNKERGSTNTSLTSSGSSGTLGKQSTTANVSTEMDLSDTLQPLPEHSLESQPSSLKRSESGSSDSSIGRTQSAAGLVSSERRKSLVEEASRHIQRKRYSMEVKDTSVIRSPSKSASSSDLMSPSRREKLIGNAADYILQRRKSQDKFAPSPPTLSYSPLDASLNNSTSSFKHLLQTSPTRTSNNRIHHRSQ